MEENEKRLIQLDEKYKNLSNTVDERYQLVNNKIDEKYKNLNDKIDKIENVQDKFTSSLSELEKQFQNLELL